VAFCPASGTGRAAVMTPLATHNRQTLVYVNNDRLTGATLLRLDTATSNKTTIYASTTTNISHAQLSTDGQWILFVSTAHNLSKLQLIRLDG
jgi:Tol biopolymer transport system component